MSQLYDLALAPFVDLPFLRRALVGAAGVALGGGPIGTVLVQRRMSLMGDALSHAILPGAAIGFLIGGLSLPALSLGGVVAGLVVALLSGLVSRVTALREDASFAAFYLISLALGVLIISTRGSTVDLLHVLFGSVLAIDDATLILVASIATVTLAALAILYRPLVLDGFDPTFLRAIDGRGTLVHQLFLGLVVLNLVAGFQALGTLMAVGLMMLPAAAARFWVRDLWALGLLSAAIGIAAAYAGLVVSYRFDLPSGPTMVLAAGLVYIVSVTAGPLGSIAAARPRRRHLAG